MTPENQVPSIQTQHSGLVTQQFGGGFDETIFFDFSNRRGGGCGRDSRGAAADERSHG